MCIMEHEHGLNQSISKLILEEQVERKRDLGRRMWRTSVRRVGRTSEVSRMEDLTKQPWKNGNVFTMHAVLGC